MSGWTDDPELLGIFRAEVDERLAAMRDGLLRLEEHPAPRQLVDSLMRDAHTVKGSARALALDGVVALAHRAEDLLGGMRDGRLTVRHDLVDLLLTTSDGISRAMPGSARPVPESDLAALLAALDLALTGAEQVQVPRLGDPAPAPAAAGDDLGAGWDPGPGRGRGDVVSVPSRRVHAVLDLVGEAELEVRRIERAVADLLALVAEHSDPRLRASARELRGQVEDVEGRLGRLREGALGLAMVPVGRVVAAFPQLVREVAADTGRQVRLVLEGEDVELDTRVLGAVADALKHLVTNAVTHGCEPAAERQRLGKPVPATVRVNARAAGSTVVVEVCDDGAGIDEERVRAAAVEAGLLAEGASVSGPALLGLLFTPGFTTLTEVTTSAGRGVGLDVVRQAVDDLGGSVEVTSEVGVGTRFVLTLPVTLGVMRCLVARVGDERYAVPVTTVVETVNLRGAPTTEVAGVPVLMRHGAPVPLADLAGVLGATGDQETRAAVVVRQGGAGHQLAWAVHDLEGELELVVKDLGGFLGRQPAISGATIDSDGSILLLLDMRELALAVGMSAPRPVGAPAAPPRRAAPDRARVLVVEDSVGVRELQRVILEGAGYEVLTAVDGQDGAARLSGDPVDLVLSDVEMPGMDGFTLTRAIRRTRGWEDVPVVIMTSRGAEADKRAGLDAGANAYLLKSEFDQAELVSTVRRLLGR